MTPETLDEALEHACGTPEYLDLCRTLTLWEKERLDDPRRFQQIGQALIGAIESGLVQMVKINCDSRK